MMQKNIMPVSEFSLFICMNIHAITDLFPSKLENMINIIGENSNGGLLRHFDL